MKTRLEKEINTTMTKNPSNWKGMFYFNPQDPRLFVPKAVPGRGFTFNFASPYSWVTLGLIFIIIIVFAIVTN